jgi:hypothetical protein
VRASSSEGIRVDKLRRYSTFMVSSKESTGVVPRKVRVRVSSAGIEGQVLRKNI